MRLRLLAAIAVVALLLTACGTQGGGSTSAGTEAAEPAAASTADGGGGGDAALEGTITVWHYFSIDEQVQVMDDLAAKFESAHEGVTVENVFVPYDQMNSKLISSAGAQTGPDVVVFNGAETATLALADVLAPMDDWWAEFEDADQFPDSVIHQVEDTTYAVQGYVNLLGLWYNADILSEIGVEPPTNLEELESAMAAAKDAGYMGITMSGLPQSQGEWQAYPWLTSQGFTYESPDEQAVADAFAMVRGWVDEGYLSPEVVTWDQTVPFQVFTGGEVAFAENGNWQLGAASADADFEYGVVPMPVGEEGNIYLGGEGQAVGAFSENPELAWTYLTETFYDAEGQMIPFDVVGSIPSREDVANSEAVTSSELLQPFAQSLTELGANYPAPSIPPEAVQDVQLGVGEAWSAALGGQQSPEEAAASVMSLLEGATQ
jgi:multiple sugar transport system substrate-binding protein